jgi:hypothetical protein
MQVSKLKCSSQRPDDIYYYRIGYDMYLMWVWEINKVWCYECYMVIFEGHNE